eukprot:3699108-Rhodomonas_salina.2
MHPYARPDQNSSQHMLFMCNHVTGTEDESQESTMEVHAETEVRNEIVNQSIEIEPLVIPVNALGQDQDQNSQGLTDTKTLNGENEATKQDSTNRKRSEPEDEPKDQTTSQDGFREDKRRARPSEESSSIPSQPSSQSSRTRIANEVVQN